MAAPGVPGAHGVAVSFLSYRKADAVSEQINATPAPSDEPAAAAQSDETAQAATQPPEPSAAPADAPEAASASDSSDAAESPEALESPDEAPEDWAGVAADEAGREDESGLEPVSPHAQHDAAAAAVDDGPVSPASSAQTEAHLAAAAALVPDEETSTAEAATDSGAPAEAAENSQATETEPTEPTEAELTEAELTEAELTEAAPTDAVDTGEQAPTPAPSPAPAPSSTPAPSPAPASAPSDAAKFGRVAEDGTVFVRTPEGERAVGSYPGASQEEALAYFARKFDEVDSLADLLYQRVTQTDLSAKDAADSLAKLREATADINAVGDLVALQAKIENIATALEARRVVEAEQRAEARAAAMAKREEIVAEAERIAAQPENKVQWKASSARMRALLDEWKAAQRGGPKLDRESEQALWQRLSSSRNSFDKMRRVHFAQLGSQQQQAKAAKEELVEEAEKLSSSTDWGATAGAYKRLMDRWRHAGRASRSDDDALWKRFKAAQDAFFGAKDAVVAAENEEFKANLVVKEELLTQAQAILPVKNLEQAKSALRGIQEKWDAAGKVPRSDMDRVEKGMRRVEQAVRDAEDKRWKATNPEVAARAASLASQAEAALEKYRKDLAKAEASGDAKRIAKAREALQARESWLKQARAGLAEFGG